MNKDSYTVFGIYGTAGIQLAAAVVGGLFLGDYLDDKFKTAPWLTILGLLMGSVGGFWNLFKFIKWFERGKNDKKD